jgi:hypothetical protein
VNTLRPDSLKCMPDHIKHTLMVTLIFIYEIYIDKAEKSGKRITEQIAAYGRASTKVQTRTTSSSDNMAGDASF